MKKYVSSEEIDKLSEIQKETLRKLWKPGRYELIIVPDCKNVKNKLYDHKTYVIQDIIVCDKNKKKYCNISSYQGNICACGQVIFKSLPLEYVKLPCKLEDNLCDPNKKIFGDGFTPFYYINKKDCLPLLSISIMIEILCENKCKKDFLLKYNEEESICVVNGITQYSDSLCDSLWGVLKSIL